MWAGVAFNNKGQLRAKELPSHLLQLLLSKLTVAILVDHCKQLGSFLKLVVAQIAITIQIKHLLELFFVDQSIAIGVRCFVVVRQRHPVGRVIQPTTSCLRSIVRRRYPLEESWLRVRHDGKRRSAAAECEHKDQQRKILTQEAQRSMTRDDASP